MRRRTLLLYIFLSITLLFIIFPLPDQEPPYSKQLYGDDNQLLSAVVSSEQQWCFPVDDTIPEHLKTCIILYEDAYIGYHPGINPVSILKSFYTNYKSGRTVRGASTLAMQVMRMKNKNSVRSWSNKIWEALSAIKFSLINKDENIIIEWCRIAPFGGNTIGIKAAALRYFNRPLDKLSWSEYALLTVMPNGPSTANLTKNRNKLKQKRNQLLQKLHQKGYFDSETLQLYTDEDLPVILQDIPQHAYHLLRYLSANNPGTNVFYTTVKSDIQLNTEELINREASFLQIDDINNLAAVILDVQTNQLVAYHGNIRNSKGKFSYVDIAQSARSYGSLLKPFLYAYALDKGELLPYELVADIPTAIGDFQPRNFDRKYRGAVPFNDMLLLSLNVPAVRVLNYVGLQGFYSLIQQLQLSYLNKGAEHYGLSIILGGGESSLWDLSRIYKGLAQNYLGLANPYGPVRILKNTASKKTNTEVLFSPFAIDYTVNTMSDLTRPREEKSWDLYENDYKIAWKTGTSYGHKDAWSVGFNGKYVVGVWVGNESGEGRFNLTGISKASPIMFKIFNILPDNAWFGSKPVYPKKEIISVCKESGKLAGLLCQHKMQLNIGQISQKLMPCTYHIEVPLDRNGQALPEFCKDLAVSRQTYFVLPSFMEYYYREGHPGYKSLPEYNPDCIRDDQPLKIIYPAENVKIFLPKSTDVQENQIILNAYHRDKEGILYWFINDRYAGTTRNGKHELPFKGTRGQYVVQITDQYGNSDKIKFEIL